MRTGRMLPGPVPAPFSPPGRAPDALQWRTTDMQIIVIYFEGLRRSCVEVRPTGHSAIGGGRSGSRFPGQEQREDVSHMKLDPHKLWKELDQLDQLGEMLD